MDSPKYPNKILNADRQVVSPKAPCVYLYDARGQVLVDYVPLPDDIDYIVFRSVVVNTLEEHLEVYAKELQKLLSRGLSSLSAENYMNRAAARVETVLREIGGWSTDKEYAVLLPYAQVALDENGSTVDHPENKPFVNGMWVVCRYRD